MNLQQRIEAFSKLGDYLQNQTVDEFKLWCANAQSLNQWFTEANVKLALEGIVEYCDEDNLKKWTSEYDLPGSENKKIGVVMAGNIPLVGFHDYLSVLISGNSISAKTSSKDSYLLQQVHKVLIDIEPFFSTKVEFVERLTDVDAYIATGSDNSARYFEQYFSKKPNIIRKNRTSIAVLSGNETNDELDNLSNDIFQYFGLGCRNITFLMVPEKYNWEPFFEACKKWEDTIHHSKYLNNYEYSRSVLLVKQVPHLDNGFLIVKQDDALNSTISVLNYKVYSSNDDVNKLLAEQKEKIQCIVGANHLPFGSVQKPNL